jgi:hypothetical protein
MVFWTSEPYKWLKQTSKQNCPQKKLSGPVKNIACGDFLSTLFGGHFDQYWDLNDHEALCHSNEKNLMTFCLNFFTWIVLTVYEKQLFEKSLIFENIFIGVFF